MEQEEISKQVLSHDSHSILKSVNELEVANVAESTVSKFPKKSFAFIIVLIFLLAGFFLVSKSAYGR